MNKLERGEIMSKKIKQGWYILAGCMIIQAIPFGIANNIQPQFISYVVEGESLSISSFSLIFTIGTLISAVAVPFIGGIYAKINIKAVFLAGAFLSGVGFMSFCLANKLWHFYTIAGIVQIGTATISAIGVPLMINAWFGKKIKGKMLGLAFAGGSLGNIFLQRFVAASLMDYGYKASYFWFGAVSLGVSITIGLLIVKLPSRSDQIVTLERESKQVASNDGGKLPVPDATLAECKGNVYFWMFAVSFVFIGIYVSGLSVQYPAYLKNELGFSGLTVGSVGSTLALFALVGNLLGGILLDKMGYMKSILTAFVLVFSSCVVLMFVKYEPSLAFLFAGLNGLSVFISMFGPAYLVGSFFGKKEFGPILGIVNLGVALGFAMGSTLFGFVIDKTGYGFVWILALIFIVLGYGALLISSSQINKIKH